MDYVKTLDPADIFNKLETLSETGDPPTGTARIIDIGSSEFISFFEKEILEDYIGRGGSTCRFFEGTYGSGKTHILQLIEDFALDKGYIVCHIDLKKNLSFERWDQITCHILENCYMKRDDGTIIRKFPEILAEFEFLDQVEKESYKKQLFDHPCLKNAIGYALERSTLNDEEWEVLRSYLLGQKVYVRDLKRYGFKHVKKSLNNKNAEQFLNTFLNSVSYLSQKGTILLYDETDRSWMSIRPPPRKVQNAANLIRRFIDACSSEEINGTLAVFAMLPNFIMDCISCYPALGQRLMFQETISEVAWRSPVLSVNAVNIDFIDISDEFERREVFLDKALKKFEEIAIYCGAKPGLITEELRKEAESILEKNVGDEYKRELIKFLTTATILRIDRYEGY